MAVEAPLKITKISDGEALVTNQNGDQVRITVFSQDFIQAVQNVNEGLEKGDENAKS